MGKHESEAKPEGREVGTQSVAREFDIVALGEPLLEFNQTQAENPNFLQGFGGDTSNTVIAAARQGVRCAYLTRVGGDTFGQQLLALWQAENVDTQGVRVDAQADTGLYFVHHDSDGHHFSYRRRDSAASRMQPDDLQHGLIEKSHFLHVSGISLALSASACDTVFAAMARARAAGTQVCLDSNLRLYFWSIDRARAILCEAMRLADIFLPSLDDMQPLTGQTDATAVLAWIRAVGMSGVVVLKQGRDGAILDLPLSASNSTPSLKEAQQTHLYRIPPMKVKAVDATGAGDCFAGNLLARRVQGDNWYEAVRYANAAAALSTQGFGAVGPLPTALQVSHFLNQHSVIGENGKAC